MVGSASTQAPVKTTGETIAVGCKIPTGIYMQRFRLEKQVQPRPDGTDKSVMVAVAISERIKLNGSAKFRGGERQTEHDVHHGAGITFGVPADEFHAWLNENRDADFVKKGLVFAHERDVQGKAREHKSELTGLEPLDPKNLPAEFRGKITKADVA